MAKVVVVNRQEIDGKVRRRGEVIEVSDGRARDLIAEGKVRVSEQRADAPVKKEAVKNG